jgi:2-hydroxychromene-2-carboxylate isomerase
VAISAPEENAAMPEPRTVTVYIDYKSPYAYLAKDPADELARDFPVRLDWMPYRLDIPSFLGSARLDESGRIVEEHRTRTNGGASSAARRRSGTPRSR